MSDEKNQAEEPVAAIEGETPPDAGGAEGGGQGEGTEDDALDAKRMTLLEHLSELRIRLRNAAIVFIVAMIGSVFFVRRFFEILTRPVRRGLEANGFEVVLHTKGVTEGFWVFMKLAIVAGILIASPFIFWELWKFVAPGLYRREKKMAGLVTAATAGCFLGGAFFGYGVLSEPAASALLGLIMVDPKTTYTTEFAIKPLLMMDDVANFLMMMVAGCGVAFELPVVLAVLGWLGVISKDGLVKFYKYAVVLSVVVGGVLTPSPDPWSQLLLAGPLFVLYNISIGLVWLIERARKRRDADLEREYGA